MVLTALRVLLIGAYACGIPLVLLSVFDRQSVVRQSMPPTLVVLLVTGIGLITFGAGLVALGMTVVVGLAWWRFRPGASPLPIVGLAATSACAYALRDAVWLPDRVVVALALLTLAGLVVDVRRMLVELALSTAVPATIITTDEALRVTLTGPPPMTIDALATDGGTVRAADFDLTPTRQERESRLAAPLAGGGPRMVLRNARADIVITRGK